MLLSPANALQHRTGSALLANPATVVLDNPTAGGGTVIVEFVEPPAAGTTPPSTDWVLDASRNLLMVWRLSNVPAGVTSWDFTATNVQNWAWQVTEWDTVLDQDPLDGSVSNAVSGVSVTSVSTGVTGQNLRPETVCLATHYWRRAAATGQTFTWGGYATDPTLGFAKRDETRLDFTTVEGDACWSWRFNDAVGLSECIATVNTSPQLSTDTYTAILVIYAATAGMLQPGVAVMG